MQGEPFILKASVTYHIIVRMTKCCVSFAVIELFAQQIICSSLKTVKEGWGRF